MADYYQQAVVNPLISDVLVNALDLEMLRAFGLQSEPIESAAATTYYFYAGEYCESGCLMIESVRKFLHDLGQEYPQNGHRPEWVNALETELDELAEDEDTAAELEPLDLGIGPEDVFQAILNKPENTGPDAVDEILIEGAFTCSKMRSDGFGGWVTRITRDTIRSTGTQTMQERLRSEEALVSAAKEVLSRWECGDLADAVRRLETAVEAMEHTP